MAPLSRQDSTYLGDEPLYKILRPVAHPSAVALSCNAGVDASRPFGRVRLLLAGSTVFGNLCHAVYGCAVLHRGLSANNAIISGGKDTKVFRLIAITPLPRIITLKVEPTHRSL